MGGVDQMGPEYAPHMWLQGHFIYNSEQVVEIGEWSYRAGYLDDETIVAERWKGDRFSGKSSEKIDRLPDQLAELMKSVSRKKQEAFQREMEQRHGPPR